MKTSLILSLLSAVILSSVFAATDAKADGVQICVDGNQSRYKVDITNFAVDGTNWIGVIHSQRSDAIPNGTNLRNLKYMGKLADSRSTSVEELAFTLKSAAPLISSTDSNIGGGEMLFRDEPRVYKMNGLDVICTSTMSADEYAQMPN